MSLSQGHLNTVAADNLLGGTPTGPANPRNAIRLKAPCFWWGHDPVNGASIPFDGALIGETFWSRRAAGRRFRDAKAAQHPTRCRGEDRRCEMPFCTSGDRNSSHLTRRPRCSHLGRSSKQHPQGAIDELIRASAASTTAPNSRCDQFFSVLLANLVRVQTD